VSPFTLDMHQTRVVFGAGCFDQLGVELERFGVQRVMIISTPGRASFVDQLLAAAFRGRKEYLTTG